MRRHTLDGTLPWPLKTRSTENRVARKLDALADYQYHLAKRDFAQLRNDASEAEEWRRDQMRKHADRCLEHQRNYDEGLEPHGKRAPQPVASIA